MMRAAGAETTFVVPAQTAPAARAALGGARSSTSRPERREFRCADRAVEPAARFRTRLADRSGRTSPIFAAEPERIARWARRIGDGGFSRRSVWQGNPDPSRRHRRAPFRLPALAPLAAIEGVRLISLQKGSGGGSWRRRRFTVESLGEEFRSRAPTLSSTRRR